MASILIADDEPHVRALLRMILSPTFRVIEAGDGAAALKLATEHRPAVAILDVRMPHLSGHEVCRMLRAADATRDIPVIMITANGTQEDRRAAIAIGADHFLAKPFSPAVLLRLVTALIAELGIVLA
ncbi:MAG: response regulator [Chloroflexi bacterium]|nr:response regulator [Chloroflexota bacterium]